METKVIEINSLADLPAILSAIFGGDLSCIKGVDTEKKPQEDDKSYNLDFFVKKVAERNGWKPEKANGWLASIERVCPIAALSIVLREIAIELDKKYEDHIENCEKVFIISTLDGRIHEASKAQIKNYRNFAAFRTLEDAKLACSILREKLKSMYARRK